MQRKEAGLLYTESSGEVNATNHKGSNLATGAIDYLIAWISQHEQNRSLLLLSGLPVWKVFGTICRADIQTWNTSKHAHVINTHNIYQ